MGDELECTWKEIYNIYNLSALCNHSLLRGVLFASCASFLLGSTNQSSRRSHLLFIV